MFNFVPKPCKCHLVEVLGESKTRVPMQILWMNGSNILSNRINTSLKLPRSNRNQSFPTVQHTFSTCAVKHYS